MKGKPLYTEKLIIRSDNKKLRSFLVAVLLMIINIYYKKSDAYICKRH